MEIETIMGTHFIRQQDWLPFYPCRCIDGLQLILGWFDDALIAIKFDIDGRLLDYHVYKQKILVEPYRRPESAVALQKELTATESPIRLRVFYIDELAVGIEDRPRSYTRFLANPEKHCPNPLERNEFKNEIDEWDRKGMFVVKWGQIFWMNSDGTIHST